MTVPPLPSVMLPRGNVCHVPFCVRRKGFEFAGPELDGVMFGVRLGPCDADRVQIDLGAEIDHDPLRMEGVVFAGEGFGQVRIRLPIRLEIAVGEARPSVAVSATEAAMRKRRWKRMVAADRRRPEFVLEEQSISDQGFTGEDDSLHPQWVMIDLGAKVDVNAIRIAWANPYARRYAVQFWTGELEPFYDGTQAGHVADLSDGRCYRRPGRTVTLKLVTGIFRRATCASG